MDIHAPNPKVLDVRGCTEKNPSLTLARDSVKIEYVSERQPSSYELAFGVELGPNPYSKNSHRYFAHQILELNNDGLCLLCDGRENPHMICLPSQTLSFVLYYILYSMYYILYIVLHCL